MRVTSFIRAAALKTIVMCAALAALAGCAGKDSRDIIDRTGRTVVVAGAINRVVSTAPSNTEIIVDLGMADKLVAVDKYSVDVYGLPENLAIVDFSYPDAEALLGLEPDLILANGHNTTVSGDDPFRLLKEMGIPVAYIPMSTSINEIYNDIAFVADLLQAPDRGVELVAKMKARVDALAEKKSLIKEERSVYFEVSAAPEMFTFGENTYINDMISIIGGRNIFAHDAWAFSPSAEEIIERNPDVILTSVGYLDDPIAEIKSRYGFDNINAVINKRVYRLDTNSMNRPSARIVLALEQMARAVYPEVYE